MSEVTPEEKVKIASLHKELKEGTFDMGRALHGAEQAALRKSLVSYAVADYVENRGPEAIQSLYTNAKGLHEHITSFAKEHGVSKLDTLLAVDFVTVILAYEAAEEVSAQEEAKIATAGAASEAAI